MGKIAIVTDSNSGITQDQARELGVSVFVLLQDIALREIFSRFRACTGDFSQIFRRQYNCLFLYYTINQSQICHIKLFFSGIIHFFSKIVPYFFIMISRIIM